MSAPVMMQADLFSGSRRLFEVALDDEVRKAAAAGAVFVFNLSGGKDSAASSYAAGLWLDSVGHPRDRRIGIHADLGRAEWRSTPAVVEATAARLGLPLLVVRRTAGDLVARWEKRFENGKERYSNLETYNLIGPWSQANKRFCTAELKSQVIGPELARLYAGRHIVQVIGIRREESAKRRSTEITKADTRFAKPGNKQGTRMMLWHPAVDWQFNEVMDCHAKHSIPLHEAYTEFGSTRLSCAFCVLASLNDLQAASRAAGNADLFRHLVGMEAASTFSFQPDRWLADVAPGLLTEGLRADIERAKREAAERRAIEAAMPEGLRYVKGWPLRAPTRGEAAEIVAARRPILARHGLPELFPTPSAVIDRFEALLADKALRAAAESAPKPPRKAA